MSQLANISSQESTYLRGLVTPYLYAYAGAGSTDELQSPPQGESLAGSSKGRMERGRRVPPTGEQGAHQSDRGEVGEHYLSVISSRTIVQVVLQFVGAMTELLEVMCTVLSLS